MSYVDNTLVADEHILYRARLHWRTFIATGLIALIFAVAAITLLVSGQTDPLISVALLAVGLVPLIASYIQYRSSEFAVTDKRVLIKTGVFTRRTLETLLDKVENISVDQGILGRLLNYGTIQVTGTGATKETFENISAPLEFRKQVQAATLNYQTLRYKPDAMTLHRDERDCPYCAERILAKASVCRFCGRQVMPTGS